MECPKCKMSMHRERFIEMGESFYSFRCIICGEILDSVILENRIISGIPTRININPSLLSEEKDREELEVYRNFN